MGMDAIEGRSEVEVADIDVNVGADRVGARVGGAVETRTSDKGLDTLVSTLDAGVPQSFVSCSYF